MKSLFRTFLLILFSAALLNATPKKFLFDAAHYQTAGNADWVIDEDNHVPGRYPTPAQSTITSTTPETYWTGAISSWGIALVKLGHQVETLPAGTAITYGTSNAQDLQNYDVFIVDEPNSPFTASERNAIISFVQHGGGLLLISDHTNADRNGDGWDAVAVWDDLFRNNSYAQYVFGFKVDSNDITETTSNIKTGWQSNVILNGPQGAVSQLAYHNGATFTLYPSINSSVQGLIWRSSSSQGNSNVMCVSSTYGTGRVFGIGDSSPQDDGTGSSGHTLYSSWLTEVNGDHAKLHLNACLWLAKITGVTNISENILPADYSLSQNYPNPFNPSTTIKFNIAKNSFVSIKVFDVLGKEIASLVNENLSAGTYSVNWNAADFSSGVYYYSMNAGGFSGTKQMILTK
jgi:hypothetical protein